MSAERFRDPFAELEKAARVQLSSIGSRIGYGNAQHILGQLWDEMLQDGYGIPPGRGRMGVTVDDDLPPIPKSAKLRREAGSNGSYSMVPAYSVDELKAFAHAAIQYHLAKKEQT